LAVPEHVEDCFGVTGGGHVDSDRIFAADRPVHCRRSGTNKSIHCDCVEPRCYIVLSLLIIEPKS
jgi:hypothetical protein